VRLYDAAMATSGGEEQFFEHEGRRYSHIIDPRTGYPAAGVLSATVVAPSAAVADALATAFYVGGRTLAERYCATHTDVLAVMLETGAERPVVFGHNAQCEVEVASD
jgi:thiamine biosynthesis lipoprotein